MPFDFSDNLNQFNPNQIQDSETTSLQQYSLQGHLATNQKIKDVDQNQNFAKNEQFKKPFFLNDLIKMIQISLIVVLVFFIGFMMLLIVNEIKDLGGGSQARQVSFEKERQKSQIVTEVQLTTKDKQKQQEDINEENLKGSHIKVVQSNNKEKQEVNFVSDNKNGKNLHQTIQIGKFQRQEGKSNLIDQKQQDNKNENSQQFIEDKTNPGNIDQGIKTTQQGSKNYNNPKPTIITSIVIDGKQVYDPVLIQMDKRKQRMGNNYKDQIYITRNTKIEESQYKMAKQLIELTKYYNAKTKKFDIKETPISQYQCVMDGIQCGQKQKYIDKIVQNEKRYYAQKYKQKWLQIQQELPFCVIVPSYKNNKNSNIFKNLNSIFQQQYSNFHIVYIDDNSSDGTKQTVQNYIQINQIPTNQLNLIVNSQNKKALNNIYNAAHQQCRQKEIMIIVDGDDYLIGTQVFKLLNFHYQTKKLLAAYTNYLRINEPYYVKVGTSTSYTKNVIAKKTFRKNFYFFRASHLRSFYVDLFRKIKVQDLQDQQGNFFTAANDFAITMPILEMSAPHFEYIPELTYLYDSGTGLNNFQSKQGLQTANAKIIAKRKIYPQVNVKEFYQTKSQDSNLVQTRK